MGPSGKLRQVSPATGPRARARAQPKMAPLRAPPPLPPRARLRRSGRGPAARALQGGGCCDGEAAAEPEPRSLSHLRHLGLGPPRAGRSCPCPGQALEVGSRPPAVGGPRSPFPAAAWVPRSGPIPAGGPPAARISTAVLSPLVGSTSVLTRPPPQPLPRVPRGCRGARMGDKKRGGDGGGGWGRGGQGLGMGRGG